MRLFFSYLMVYVTWQVCLILIRKQSREDAKRIASCMRRGRVLFGIGIAVYVGRLNNYIYYTDTANYLLCFVTAISLACLIFAVFSDLAIRHAYRFCWYGVYIPCGMIGMGSLLSERGFELVLFFLLQFLWFHRFYGRADCHGFFAGACILFLYGGSLWDYVMQMAYAFGILFVIQLFRKNINRWGNLKNPVAFLPYVAAGLLLRLSCF